MVTDDNILSARQSLAWVQVDAIYVIPHTSIYNDIIYAWYYFLKIMENLDD